MIGAVVHVDATVVVGPAVDADAVEAAQGVDAGAAVLTRIRHLALVNVVHTVTT